MSPHDLPLADQIRATLAQRTGTSADDWFLVLRARHAMHLAFDAIRQARRARYVVTQAFTCVTAINPIVSAGMHPRYADISPDTLSICLLYTSDAADE